MAGLTYAQAGVAIDAGNALVDRIKPAAARTAQGQHGRPCRPPIIAPMSPGRCTRHLAIRQRF